MRKKSVVPWVTLLIERQGMAFGKQYRKASAVVFHVNADRRALDMVVDALVTHCDCSLDDDCRAPTKAVAQAKKNVLKLGSMNLSRLESKTYDKKK
jgi:hypothetical protein